jgi:hypothetical protein
METEAREALSPTSYLLLFFSFVGAAMSLLANGLSAGGVGPVVLALAGGIWQFWMDYLRHRVWLQHHDSGFVPGTQHLAMAGALGWGIAVVVAMAWAVIALKSRLPPKTIPPATSAAIFLSLPRSSPANFVPATRQPWPREDSNWRAADSASLVSRRGWDRAFATHQSS